MLDNCYYFEYLDYLPHLYCCTHNVSVDMSFGLLLAFHVEPWKPIKNLELNPLFELQGVDSSNSIIHNRVQVLSYSK